MTQTNYPPPVDRLLSYGRPQGMNSKTWPNYLELGFGPEHVPDLIRLALDQKQWSETDENPIVWAPVHAWRTLGQLRAAEAVQPLLELLPHIDLDMDDWVGEELPQVFQQIGPAAVPALAAYFADPSHKTFARVAASEGLWQIGEAHPEAREACVQALMHVLEAPEQDDETVNAFAISGLIELKAVEAAAIIERAFAEERVDESVMGDWEDVQINLGLKAEREHPRKPDPFALPWPDDEAEPERPVPEAIRAWNETVRAKKAAAEQAKAARKEKKKRKRGRGQAGKHRN